MTVTNATSRFRWIVGQEGSRETYAIPLGFQRLQVLRVFYADLWCRWGRSLLQRGPKGARALATRWHPEIPSEKVVSFGLRSVVVRAHEHFRRGRLSPAEMAGIWNEYGQWFACQLRDHLGTLKLDAQRDVFFSYNTNCLEALESLRTAGIFTMVDQVDPGQVEEQMVLEEAERWPGWSRVPGIMPKNYWDRLKAEWETADLVLVNSQWSANALRQQGVPEGKIIIVPLSVNLAKNHEAQPVNPVGTLKVLWLGSLILRKGIQYLVEAARRLQGQNIEFLLAGPVGISDSVVRSFPPNVKVLGRVTRDQLGVVYRQAHVFVLPTISDGFGVTQLEAMAHGLPVIATPNCGQVVTHGTNGLIVPARDVDALVDAVIQLDNNRHLIRAFSENALLTVQKYTPESNAQLIVDEVERIRECKQNGSVHSLRV